MKARFPSEPKTHHDASLYKFAKQVVSLSDELQASFEGKNNSVEDLNSSEALVVLDKFDISPAPFPGPGRALTNCRGQFDLDKGELDVSLEMPYKYTSVSETGRESRERGTAKFKLNKSRSQNSTVYKISGWKRSTTVRVGSKGNLTIETDVISGANGIAATGKSKQVATYSLSGPNGQEKIEGWKEAKSLIAKIEAEAKRDMSNDNQSSDLNSKPGVVVLADGTRDAALHFDPETKQIKSYTSERRSEYESISIEVDGDVKRYTKLGGYSGTQIEVSADKITSKSCGVETPTSRAEKQRADAREKKIRERYDERYEAEVTKGKGLRLGCWVAGTAVATGFLCNALGAMGGLGGTIAGAVIATAGSVLAGGFLGAAVDDMLAVRDKYIGPIAAATALAGGVAGAVFGAGDIATATTLIGVVGGASLGVLFHELHQERRAGDIRTEYVCQKMRDEFY